MPSRFEESLGLANLEAMACACIVLSSDFAAASEYIDSGVDGLRLPRDGFVAAAMLAIRRLEQDLPGAEAMSHAARRRAAGFKESRVMAGLPALLGLQGSLP
jgi:glycosyltransferase involved in cell wall biosynthesis